MKEFSVPQGLRGLIDRLVLQRVDFQLGGDSDDPTTYGRDEVADLSEANVASSLRRSEFGLAGHADHAVVLDLDVPAWLVPSTTEGHSHLYIDVRCAHEDYMEFLNAAAQIGVIEPGYASASQQRGYSAVRLPWVRKEAGGRP